MFCRYLNLATKVTKYAHTTKHELTKIEPTRMVYYTYTFI